MPGMKRIFLLLLFTQIAILIPDAGLQAQDPPNYLFLDDYRYSYIDYSIDRGDWTPRFIFLQPWNTEKLPENSKWNPDYWRTFYKSEQFNVGLQFDDNIRYSGDVHNRYRATASFSYRSPHLTLVNRTAVDNDFKRDPMYAGDLSESSNWLFGRVEDAYIELNYARFRLFLGRMQRNWGVPGEPGLILSDNPYSYDHLLLSYSTDWFNLSLIFARLEDLPAVTYDIIPEPEITRIPKARKYLVGHRLDFHVSDDFQFAFSEMATYGGADREMDLSFLNPMTFYYGLQRNDRKLISGMWALDMFYRPAKGTTLFGQFLLDDIVVNNDPGVDDRARFPDRLGVLVSVRSADWFPGLNTHLTYARIWNRTYQSRNTYENYHYRGLGLGYPVASSEELKINLSYWSLYPVYFENRLIIGRYGSVAFSDYFPLKHESFPVPPVINNIVDEFEAHYVYSDNIEALLKLQYFKDPRHYLNRIDTVDDWRIEFGFRLRMATGFSFGKEE